LFRLKLALRPQKDGPAADKRQTANARELTRIEGKDQGLWPTVMRFVADLLSSSPIELGKVLDNNLGVLVNK
jgi:hypothetical protein